MTQWPRTDWQAAGMISRDGNPVPLKAVDITVAIQDLFAEVAISHDYANREATDIEVSYTFPVPEDAVLMGIEARIGEREIIGQVAARSEAESRYEDAIAEGDSAILLQEVRPGLHSLSLGNLRPNERARISYHYALALRWNGDRVALRLPTTIAPKYGDPAELGLQPYQSLDADPFYTCRVNISASVSGLLADARVSSPSHAIERAMESTGLKISLKDSDHSTDRDFVLNFRLQADQKCAATICPDIEGFAAMLSYCPSVAQPTSRAALNFVVVVDCSGSMSGDSIRQAGKALAKIATSLSPKDRVNIILFGTEVRSIFSGQVVVNTDTKNQIRRLARGLQADMGGTELVGALQAACRSFSNEEAGDILLITDGAVYAEDQITQLVTQYPHRIFCVGVGSAVSEGVLRNLSQKTGGSAEFVSPNEVMAERITRHFERIRSGRINRLTVLWPQAESDRLPLSEAIYNGDTVNLYYWFDKKPSGTARIITEIEGGAVKELEVAISQRPRQDALTSKLARNDAPESIARFAAAQRLKATDDRAIGCPIAIDYQLISSWTNFVAVDKRESDDKAGAMPELRKVPQVLAAGWGGVSTARNTRVLHSHSVDRYIMCESQHVAEAPAVEYLADSIWSITLKNNDHDIAGGYSRQEILNESEAFFEFVIEKLTPDASQKQVGLILEMFKELLMQASPEGWWDSLVNSVLEQTLEKQLLAEVLVRSLESRPQSPQLSTAIERIRAFAASPVVAAEGDKIDHAMTNLRF